VARADNGLVQPSGQTPDGTPIYDRPTHFGFILVIEGRPGSSGKAMGTFGIDGNPATGGSRASVQIVSDRPLGNGSTAICDIGPPPAPVGGVPASGMASFPPDQNVTDAINDFACRFDFHSRGSQACTLDSLRNFAFATDPALIVSQTRQYCTVPAIGRELSFPSGSTRLTLQLTDFAGNIGDRRQIVVRVP